jgi:myosin heavy subunit
MLCPAEARENEVTTIGILDIFGFEDFQKNGFDQLCINLANEQLHTFFNTHIFASEIQAYNEEGVDGAAVLFADNKNVVDLFYRKPAGLLAIIDEESFFPSATDKTLMEKFAKQLEDLEAFEMNKGGYAFVIKHFAGPINYQGDGLLEKNKDPLPNRMADCMAEATNALARLLFRDNYLAEVRNTAADTNRPIEGKSMRKGGKGKRGGGARNAKSKADKKSVSAQFSESLAALMIRMNRCLPHFVRCIKPNPDKMPKKYAADMVRKQLKYTGMLQTIEMRREGYPDRKPFRELLETYQGIAYPFSKRIEYTRRQAQDFMEKAQAKQEEIVKAKKLSGKTVHLNNWIVAKTKVFLKYWHMDVLDTLMRPFDASVVVIQTWVRRFVARSKFLRIRQIYRDQLATAANFIQDIKTNGATLFSAQQTLIEEEKRRGPEGLGIIKKLAKKEEAKLKKAMTKEATAAAAGKPANVKKLAKAMENMNKAAIKWWHKYEARRNEHVGPDGNFFPWFHGLISRKDAGKQCGAEKWEGGG